jgi:NTE family protein
MREFPDAASKPDEIWLIQVSPQRREHEPRSISEILNRRGEMSGNLALEYLPEELYKRIEVRKIEMDRELDAASKIDRRPSFVGEMFAYGERQAGEFLEGLPWSFSRQG